MQSLINAASCCSGFTGLSKTLSTLRLRNSSSTASCTNQRNWECLDEYQVFLEFADEELAGGAGITREGGIANEFAAFRAFREREGMGRGLGGPNTGQGKQAYCASMASDH
jgi:hypothetical protein